MRKNMPSLPAFLSRAFTPFHVVNEVSFLLRENGFSPLNEGDSWRLSAGGKYYVTRGGVSLIAFCVPEGAPKGFQMALAHTDSPCFKITSAITDGSYTRLCVEKYGGMLCSTWFDRPLRVAGRVFISEGERVVEKLVSLDGNVLIPSVAIHHNREANEKVMGNVAVDLLPVFVTGDNAVSFKDAVASAVGVERDAVLGEDLTLVSDSAPFLWGNENGLISSPRLDDLQCVYALLDGLLSTDSCASVPVLALLNSEEVGSVGADGADSDFLPLVLNRIAESFGDSRDTYAKMLASSFALSCDSAHAVHPAHPELSDKGEGKCYINCGIVIKENAAKRYTTDGFSAAMLRKLCADVSVPAQVYRNRADIPGGATLGCLALSHVSVPMVDLGLATLAMHSAVETAGVKDTEYLSHLAARYFSVSLYRDVIGARWQSAKEKNV
jgi:aspartyl aminopeptidase